MRYVKYVLFCLAICVGGTGKMYSQINTEQVLRIGQNSLYLEDYVLSIQYFNQIIAVKPYWAQPYFYRAIAKLSLDDYRGAEEDATLAIERNPFISGAYEVRGVALQNMGRRKEAIADYDRALEQLPYSRNILLNKALAQEDIKDYAGADSTYATLLRVYPKFDTGYVGRAKLYLAAGDTLAALADIETALSINKNSTNAYSLRSDIAIKSKKDYESALADMNEAIRLQPQFVGYFINRAFLRYNLNDYFGAMADYDYAIQLEPLNETALFNRGLLRAEVHDNNKAIDDFSKVLSLDRNNYHALYNRALLYKAIGDYRSSIADIDRVIEAFPDFSGAYFLRSENLRLLGETSKAEKDYRKSMALSKKPVSESDSGAAGGDEPVSSREDAEDVAAMFTSLLTVEDNSDIKEGYQAPVIKGRVQDQRMVVELEPPFTMSYYVTTNEIRETPYYIKEVEELNLTRALRFLLMVANREPQLSDEDVINRHFASIEYYNSYIATHAQRAIDFFGRAMDYYTLRNYQAALADLDRAIELSPDFTIAYLLRANVRQLNAKTMQLSDSNSDIATSAIGQAAAKMVNAEVLNDIDKVIELSPRMPFAWYNKGAVLAAMGDFTSAISAFNRAIELKPDFGEAYYNRGYLYLNMGNREDGMADLSKAGELGIIPSYNLLKRMTR